MSLSYVTGMCGVFKNYVQSHTEALFKLYDIRISFATFFMEGTCCFGIGACLANHIVFTNN